MRTSYQLQSSRFKYLDDRTLVYNLIYFRRFNIFLNCRVIRMFELSLKAMNTIRLLQQVGRIGIVWIWHKKIVSLKMH